MHESRVLCVLSTRMLHSDLQFQVDVLLGMKISQECLLPREARSKHYCSSRSAEFFQILKQIPSEGQML